MKIWLWFILSCKRQLKHGFFIMMMILLPVLSYSVQQLEKKDSGKIVIAVFTEEDGIAVNIIEKLMAQEGMFEFYQCESQQKLEEDVAARRAECGYVFKAGLKEKLDNKKFKRSIEIYSAPSTITAKLSQEVVFSSLIEVYGEDILEQYVKEDQIFSLLPVEEVWRDMKEQYKKYQNNGSTFSFQFETLSTKRIEAGSGKIVFPVRGMVAVYLFVIGLFSAVTLSQDEKKGLFIPVPANLRLVCKLAAMLAPVLLAGASGLAAIFVTGNGATISKEVLALSGYLIFIIIFAYLCKIVFKNPVTLCSLIPFFILGSFVFCPVFIDAAKWIPAVKILRHLFLPYYYLNLF